MKNLFVFLTIIVLASCNNSEEKREEKNNLSNLPWIDFQWKGDSVGKRYFDKAAIFLPLKLQNLPSNFTAQFDMGSNASIIYGNVFKPYLKKYSEYSAKLDTINTEISIGEDRQGELKDVTIMLDSFKYHYDILPFFKNYGEELNPDSVNTPSAKLVGTIGGDVLQNKILIMDFPNKRLAILDSLATSSSDLFDFKLCKLDNNRVKIPLQINGQEQWYLFDTGSSIFSIVTDPANWKNICDGVTVDTLQVNSWGNSYNMYGCKTKSDIYFNKTKLPQTTAYKVDLSQYVEMFKQEGISGIIGNSYFLNNTIAIDFKNKRFGILR